MHYRQSVVSDYALSSDVEAALKLLADEDQLYIHVHRLDIDAETGDSNVFASFFHPNSPAPSSHLIVFSAPEVVTHTRKSLNFLRQARPELTHITPQFIRAMPKESAISGMVLRLPEGNWNEAEPLSDIMQHSLPNVAFLSGAVGHIADEMHAFHQNHYSVEPRQLKEYIKIHFSDQHIPGEGLPGIFEHYPRFRVDGALELPNPLAFRAHIKDWRGEFSISVPIDRMHHRCLRSTDIYLNMADPQQMLFVGWGLNPAAGPLFRDWAMLELDLLLRFLPTNQSHERSEWLSLLPFLTQAILSEGEPDGLLAAHAWRLIRPLRTRIITYIQDVGTAQKDVEAAYWLSALSAGLHVAEKKSMPFGYRVASFLYAAYALHSLCNWKLRIPESTVGGNFNWSAPWGIDEYQAYSESEGPLDRSKGIAFIVGVGNYEHHSHILSRPETANGARELKQRLDNHGYLTRGCFEQSATRQEILNGMEWLREQIENAGGTVVFYFSGHGYIDKDSSEAYLLPFDADPDRIEQTGLGSQQLGRALQTISQYARRVLVLLDCCHAEGAVAVSAENFYASRGSEVLIITSSAADENSYVLPGDSVSVFTRCLLEALDGAATTPQTTIIEAFDVFRYVAQEVPRRVRRYFNQSQQPRMNSNNIPASFPILFPRPTRTTQRQMVAEAVKNLYRSDFQPARRMFANLQAGLDLVLTNTYLGTLRTALTSADIAEALAAIESINQDDLEALSPNQLAILEQVVVAYARPAFLVRNGDILIPPQDHLWHQLGEHSTALRTAIQNTGLITVPGHGCGTGFLVGPNLVLTAAHVVGGSVSPETNGGWKFDTAEQPTIDFLQEYGNSKQAEYSIVKPVLIHAGLDLSLLQIDGDSIDTYISLDVSRPTVPPSKMVATIGYPHEDWRKERSEQHRYLQRVIFGEATSGKKRCAPGHLLGWRPPSIQSGITAEQILAHDCSTLWGNSGGCVIDLETGFCIGWHVSGEYLRANYCLSASELTQLPGVDQFPLGLVNQSQ